MEALTMSITVQSPRGVEVELHPREDTTDLATIGSTFRLWGNLVDEYGLAAVHSDGLLLDVGAHIGTVAIAFLLDNPAARAIAVEPLPENVECIRQNAESAGVSDRLTVLSGAFGTSKVAYGPDVHRYIGNIGTLRKGGKATHAKGAETVKVDELTLTEIIEAYGPIDVIKTDCEGCEWALLADPAAGSVRLIFGEYHYGGAERIHELLDASHTVTAGSEPTGDFRAVWP
jgi:FkbM family methyltransferase